MSELTTESTVYVTYIASTPEKLWTALTSAEFTTKYFFGRSVESDWKSGSRWLLRTHEGVVDVEGTVEVSDPPRRLTLTWTVVAFKDLPACIVTYEIELVGEGTVRLSMTESHPTPIERHLLEGGRKGWPMILSGMKSVLETGKPLNFTMLQPSKKD